MRVCPNCGNKKKILSAMQEVSTSNVYVGKCSCPECDTNWQEVWYRHSNVTDVFDIHVPDKEI